MTRLPVSGCTIIRDAVQGAFCLFESMAMMLPVVDDMHILDMGSTDDTLELLRDIAAVNKRIHIHSNVYPWETALVLAKAQNDVVALAHHDKVLLWQADEIWHENLVQTMLGMLDQGYYNLMFWRYQLRDNFQKMYWRPHVVHRVGSPNNGMFHFVDDGKNTDKLASADICGWSQWDGKDPASIPAMDVPTCEMILDVSSMGAFRDNVVHRKRLHHPLWGQSQFTIEGAPSDKWQREADTDPIWTKRDTPFDIPVIMQWHVGRVLYEVRPELLEALKNDVAREYLDGI